MVKQMCPVCDKGKLHARVMHGTFRLRKMLKYYKCDYCLCDISTPESSRWNVARTA